MLYSNLIRPILFTRDAEQAHEATLNLLERATGKLSACAPYTHRALKVSVAGIDFPNPVGLAAGCDKNARAVTIWPRFGFGYVEVGTITAQPQPGNPRPRVFRLKEQRAIVNRLGFNSEGSEAAARRLQLLRERLPALPVPLGINIGKTKLVTDEDLVLEDYRTSFRRLAPWADFVVINISSPNTPGLRQWQQRGPLTSLLSTVMEEARSITQTSPEASPVPVFVKISPDMEEADMADLVEVAVDRGLAGIIATNTTIGRPGIAATSVDLQQGGLSGRPLRQRANEVMRFLYQTSQGRIPLIGVGGIDSAEAAYERIKSGASLIQIYTAMIYEGPYLAKRINQGLVRLMQRDGVSHISEVVGTDAGC
jgi:dihydroorotate dehydrogenase